MGSDGVGFMGMRIYDSKGLNIKFMCVLFWLRLFVFRLVEFFVVLFLRGFCVG